jgi:Zn-dependent protease with chaperone function
MKFARRWFFAFCLGLLLASLSPRAGAVQPAPTQPAQAQPAAPTNSQPAYQLPPDKLARAITLSHIRIVLDIVGSLWGLAVLWLLLATRAAAGLAAWTERLLRRSWMQGLLFFAAFFVITTLASLPLDAIGHQVSRHFGISVQGWGSWFGDLGKGLGLSILIGAPLLLLFNRVVRVSPRRYWVWLWLVTLPLTVLSVFVEPLIDPIFNKFEPLTAQHAALVTKLETVVARTGTKIPPERMFLMKASQKSNGLNAYVTGIGATKRYVMWDTATDRLPDDEILFIFGHESGHYVLNHIPKMIAGSAAGTFFIFWACAGFAGWLAVRFGDRWQLGEQMLASRQGFLVLVFSLSIAGFVLAPASNTFSRYFEHQADIYGQEALHGLVADPQKTTVSAFNHLGEAWLEDPNPNSFIEFWTYNHPSVQHRAKFAAHYDPWAGGGKGRFFDK